MLTSCGPGIYMRWINLHLPSIPESIKSQVKSHDSGVKWSIQISLFAVQSIMGWSCAKVGHVLLECLFCGWSLTTPLQTVVLSGHLQYQTSLLTAWCSTKYVTSTLFAFSHVISTAFWSMLYLTSQVDSSEVNRFWNSIVNLNCKC